MGSKVEKILPDSPEAMFMGVLRETDRKLARAEKIELVITYFTIGLWLVITLYLAWKGLQYVSVF